MSGYRANVGWGVLPRVKKEGPAELPDDYTVYSTSDTSKSCVHLLHKRFGAGIDISINRNRNNSYKQDIGLREFTVVSSGLLDIDFTINGAFAPSASDWLEYGIMSDGITIDSSSTFVNAAGTVISSPTNTSVGYVKTGSEKSESPITYEEYNKYKSKLATGQTVKIYYYVNLDGPRYFDIAYEQVNENTTFGGLNEIGVLLGCVITNFSISYESGSDAAFTFSISGYALSNYFRATSDAFDMNAILDPIPATILVGGCVSADKDGNGYQAIAQTDSAQVTVNNNVTKLGNCLKLYYSSVAIGAQVIEFTTTTYANDPNKYMSYMYSYNKFENSDVDYTIGKAPKPIPKMLIHSDNTDSIQKTATEFLDVQFTDVYVGSSNRTYNVDNAIMDEPDLRPRKVKFVVGYTDKTGVAI